MSGSKLARDEHEGVNPYRHPRNAIATYSRIRVEDLPDISDNEDEDNDANLQLAIAASLAISGASEAPFSLEADALQCLMCQG